MIVMAVVSYTKTRDALIDQVKDQIVQLSEQIVETTDLWINERKSDIVTFSQEELVQLAAQHEEIDAEASQLASTRLLELYQQNKFYEQLTLVDLNGAGLASSLSDFANLNISDREYFRESKNGAVVVSEVLESKTTKNPIFVVSAPVKNNGRIMGVLIGVVDLMSFGDLFIDPVKVGETGYAYVCDQNGQFIIHPDHSMQLKANVKDYDFGVDFMRSKNGILEYQWKGAIKMVAFAQNPQTGWKVAVGANNSELLVAVNESRQYMIWMTIITVILASILVYFITKSVADPIKNITTIASGIATGDLSQEVDIQQQDEVGQLADAFRAMTDSLRAKRDVAEQIAEGNVDVDVRIDSQEDELGHAMQKMKESIQRLVKDTGKLAGAAVEGQLDVRADVTPHRGEYKTIVSRINDTLDSVVNPIQEASQVLAKVAGRNLTERMQGMYKGDYAKIKDSINQAIDNLNNALSQVAAGADQVNSASDQISTSSQSLAEGASEQASSLEEVSSNLQEMSSMTKQNSSNAREDPRHD